MNIQATSLQDDIAKVLRTSCPPIEGGHAPVVRDLAAGLESDYYLVKLADLPEVGEDSHGRTLSVDGVFIPVSMDADVIEAMGRKYIAAALHLEARESEEAVLARRRDELAARLEVSANGGYDRLCDGERGVIDDLIAAEAELARLKEARS